MNVRLLGENGCAQAIHGGRCGREQGSVEGSATTIVHYTQRQQIDGCEAGNKAEAPNIKRYLDAYQTDPQIHVPCREGTVCCLKLTEK